MKNKIKLLIISIICILLVPLSIKADAGSAPSTMDYQVVVTNPEGTKIKDYNGKILGTVPHDTIITVLWEQRIDGILYGDVSYNGIEGYINLSDTVTYSETIAAEEGELCEESYYSCPTYYTYYDTQLYKGPSTAFGKVEDGIIPKGQVIDFKYCTGNGESVVWIYTENNGKKGWIYVYKSIFFTEEDSLYGFKSTLVTYHDKPEKVFISHPAINSWGGHDAGPTIRTDDGEIIPIKNHTEYEYTLSDDAGPSFGFYIEYNGKKGWYWADYRDGLYSSEQNSHLIVLEKNGYDLYSSRDDEKPIENLKLPYKSVVRVKYSPVGQGVYFHYYIEYNGKYYWIKDGEYESDGEYECGTICSTIIYNESDYYYPVYKIKINTPLYTYITENDKTEIEATGNEKFILYGTINVDENLIKNTQNEELSLGTWGLVEYKGEKYFIKNYEDTAILTDEKVIINDNNNNNTEKEQSSENEKTKLTPLQIGLICLGGALAIALTSVVIIILINKNKKISGE